MAIGYFEMGAYRLKNDELSYIMVPIRGKTGMRRVPIVFSVPYLSNYLNTSGLAQRIYSPLFLTSFNAPLNYPAVRKLFRDLKERTGIKKRIHPHLFRHSRATAYAKLGLSDQQLKTYFGWVGDSKMVATYTHLAGTDIDDAIIEANNLQFENGKLREKAKMLTIKSCSKCRETNPVTNSYCQRCGTPLDVNIIKEQMKSETTREDLEKLKTAFNTLIGSLDKETKEKVLGVLKDTI